MNASEVPDLVEHQLKGYGIWSHRDDQTPVDGLMRAARASGDLAPAFARALVAFLEHEDPVVRAGAIAVISEVPGHVVADELVAILEARPELFRGIKTPDGYPRWGDDLEDELIFAIGQTVTPSDRRAHQLLKHRVTSGGRFALNPLARVTPDWVVANAKAVVSRHAITGVLRCLPEPEQRRAVVSALAPWPSDDGRKLTESRPWTSMPLDEDEKAALAALILAESS